LAAVVISGGKQYLVAPGDRVLVDRLPAEPGSEVEFSRVLMVRDQGDVKVGQDDVQAVKVRARVLEHRQGTKIDVIRYKAKKRVRVHRGARAQLTALEILDFGRGASRPAAEEPDDAPRGARHAGRARGKEKGARGA
jgi:large subunit ribosomal protein L21